MASSNAVLASLQARSARIRRYHHVLESGKQNLRQDSGIPNKLTWRVEDLIVEDAEVERQTESYRMCRGEVGLGYVLRLLVRQQRSLGSDLAAFASAVFCKVPAQHPDGWGEGSLMPLRGTVTRPVVISLHLLVEDDRFCRALLLLGCLDEYR